MEVSGQLHVPTFFTPGKGTTECPGHPVTLLTVHHNSMLLIGTGKFGEDRLDRETVLVYRFSRLEFSV
jgi:hypothetical protein